MRMQTAPKSPRRASGRPPELGSSQVKVMLSSLSSGSRNARRIARVNWW